MSKKALLLNPPGSKIYIRDYYCSKVSQAGYLNHPVDLLMLSGRLSEHYDVHVIDALADRLDRSSCLRLIERLRPDVVVSLIGAVSLTEDLSFLAKLKRPDLLLTVTGDVVMDNAEQWLKQHAFIDAAILDFTSDDLLHFIEGRSGPFPWIVTRHNDNHLQGNQRPMNQEYTLPLPRHDLFNSCGYRHPFVRYREFATVLTDYGCPYECTFCIMNAIGYKARTVDNVMEELRLLKQLGKKEIYFDDQTFGVSKERTLDLCARMKQERFKFGWVCFMRVDLITEELLSAMKAAGCHTIMMGVESASTRLREKYRKGISKQQIEEAFRLCRSMKIRTVATFLLGLPEETEETAEETIDYAIKLGCDFASFNVAVPRIATALRQEALSEGLITQELVVMDQTGTEIAMATKYLSQVQLRWLRQKAVRDFYLRPGYLWQRALGISTLHELTEHLSEAWHLLRSHRMKRSHI